MLTLCVFWSFSRRQVTYTTEPCIVGTVCKDTTGTSVAVLNSDVPTFYWLQVAQSRVVGLHILGIRADTLSNRSALLEVEVRVNRLFFLLACNIVHVLEAQPAYVVAFSHREGDGQLAVCICLTLCLDNIAEELVGTGSSWIDSNCLAIAYSEGDATLFHLEVVLADTSPCLNGIVATRVETFERSLDGGRVKCIAIFGPILIEWNLEVGAVALTFYRPSVDVERAYIINSLLATDGPCRKQELVGCNT